MVVLPSIRRKYMVSRIPKGVTVPLSECVVTLASDRAAYTGTARTVGVTVTWYGATLAVNTDYTLSFANNTNIGPATVTVTGMGRFSGSVTKTFHIVSDSQAGDWSFDVRDIPDSISFSTFLDNTSGTWQICPSADESKLLAGCGTSYYMRIGEWMGFDSSTFEETEATSSGVGAGTVMFTPDGIHYLLAEPSGARLWMRTATDAYDLSSIQGTASSSLVLSYVKGACMSDDGTKLIFSAGSGTTLTTMALSSPFDLGTAGEEKVAPNVGHCGPIFVNQHNGRQLVMLNRWSVADRQTRIALITLGTPWDASSIESVAAKEFPSVTEADHNGSALNSSHINGIAVNKAGTKMVLSAYAGGKSYIAVLDLQ